jgi:hypothetical protein
LINVYELIKQQDFEDNYLYAGRKYDADIDASANSQIPGLLRPRYYEYQRALRGIPLPPEYDPG